MGDKKKKDVDFEDLENIEEVETIEEDEEDIEEESEDIQEDEHQVEDDFDDDDEDFAKIVKKSDDDKKDTKKSSKDDDDDLLDDEKESFGAKIVIAIVIIAIIIILLLKACGGKTEQFKITFDSNGGTAVSSLKVDKNGKITRPADPTKEGYIFAGWYYNDELFDFNTEVTGDMKLEARWTAVESSNVTGVTLNHSSLTLKPGVTATLIATVEPENAKDKSLTWSSSDSSIVTVDENGNIKAIKEGTAIITVTTVDGGYTATVTITVAKEVVAVTGVSFNQKTINLATGSSTTLSAVVSPSDATNKGLTWTSSDSSIATVNSSGRVTGKKEGTVTITVTTQDGGYKATITVVVKNQPVTGVKVTGSTSMTEGGSQTLKATISPSNATNKSVTWKSSDESIATVDQNGKVTAKKAGKVTITATAKDGSGKSGSITINVKEKTYKYVVTFTAKHQEGTDAVANYGVSVTRDGSNFAGYSKIVYNGTVLNSTSTQINATKVTTSIKTATIIVDGKETSATVVIVG